MWPSQARYMHPLAPVTVGLHTRMALLSLSAKKAGVFLRHFTAGEKHSINGSSGNSQPRRPPPPSLTPHSRLQANYPMVESSSLEQDRAELDTNPLSFLAAMVIKGLRSKAGPRGKKCLVQKNRVAKQMRSPLQTL